MKRKKGVKRYKNTEHYKKVKQAEAGLDKRIKETSSQFLKQRNQKIKETSSQFLMQQLPYLFFLLLRLALMTLGFTFFLLLRLALMTLGFTFFLLYRIYLVVFFPLITRLGIASWVSFPWSRWFSDNFDLTIEGRSSWSIRTKSGQGFFCLLLLLLISFGFAFFLLYKIYPTVFSTLITRLGIASWLCFPLLIAAWGGRFKDC